MRFPLAHSNTSLSGPSTLNGTRFFLCLLKHSASISLAEFCKNMASHTVSGSLAVSCSGYSHSTSFRNELFQCLGSGSPFSPIGIWKDWQNEMRFDWSSNGHAWYARFVPARAILLLWLFQRNLSMTTGDFRSQQKQMEK